MDRVVFREPIHIGELVTFQVAVNYIGRSSLEVGIRVTTEDIRLHRIRHTNSCYFTMVAVDDERKPVPVRAHVPTTEEEHRRWREAEQRRARRKAEGQ